LDSDTDIDNEHDLVETSQKRWLSTSSSKTPKPKRTQASRSAASEIADAVVLLSKSMRLPLLTWDFVMEALEFLWEDEIGLALTEEESASAMAVFHNERNAKLFCLAKNTSLRLVFLQREIEALDPVN
jgi:hypothetical protein